jgi:hypothetical protein
MNDDIDEDMEEYSEIIHKSFIKKETTVEIKFFKHRHIHEIKESKE